MDIDVYQRLAARTIASGLSREDVERHALYGLAGEVGEVLSLFQKELQGHELNREHLKRELGDVLWMVSELASAEGWKLSGVALENVEKLRKRYPEGFEPERSLHRAPGDI